MAAGSHWAARYVGEPWTPERNCFWLVRTVLLEHFGVEMRAVGIDSEDDQTAAIREAAARWSMVEEPAADGDVLICRQPGGRRHVGIVVEGRLLHSNGRMHGEQAEGAVECVSLRDLPLYGYRDIELWRLIR